MTRAMFAPRRGAAALCVSTSVMLPDIRADDRTYLARILDGLIVGDPEGRLRAGELEWDD